MAELKFNYYSLRARQARMTVGISPNWRFVLQWFSWFLMVVSLTGVVFGYATAWLILPIGTTMWALYQWWRWFLYHLPIKTDDDHQIDNILSSSILGRLPAQVSPKELAEILAQTSSAAFLLVRFGLSPRFLLELSSDRVDDMSKIWQTALEIRQASQSSTLSGGVLALALIKNFPNFEAILAKLQLSYDDLLEGVRWHDYIHAKKDQRNFLRTGGLARDWSFGYTPLLDKLGKNISQEIVEHQFRLTQTTSHQQAVAQMINILSGQMRQNVALVGPDGAGKTTLVYSLAEKLLYAADDLPKELRFRQIILLDAVALLAAAPGRGELEKLMTNILAEAYNAKNIILCLDNATVFFQEAVGSINLSNILLPVLEAGKIELIMTMNEHRFLQINQSNPKLASVINKIVINPASPAETMVAMEDRILSFEKRFKVIYMYQALKEAYRLGERYVPDLVMPGRAIKLMEDAVPFAENGLITVRAVQKSIEATSNLKLGMVNQVAEKKMLLNLEEQIHRRFINQKRAVAAVSDALRRARAGVRNQNRPIGTFLFLGPTGVGKTELAKTLAAVYFGSETSIIRLDMNEFVTLEDATRLIEDASRNPHSLTARTMQAPFSLILLDEIEKAHPAVLSTLLQVLDEGVLRDQNNRPVNFQDTIIIATSNAGAERIREYVERGYEVSKFEAQFIDELITSNQFRPEFLNRFDEILVFRPLTKSELLQVLDLIIKGINQNLAKQNVKIKLSDEAKTYLVELGYDPRLGARPMRRVVQSTVESLVARALIEKGNLEEQDFNISLADLKNIVDKQKSADSILKST